MTPNNNQTQANQPMDDKQADVFRDKATTAIQQGNWESALENLRVAHDIRPQGPYIKLLLIKALVHLKHFDEIKAHLDFLSNPPKNVLDEPALNCLLIELRLVVSVHNKAEKGGFLSNIEKTIYDMDTGVNKTISEQDEMFKYALSRTGHKGRTENYYFSTGKEICLGILKYFVEANIDLREKDLLDFAAGYGRITRWFVHLFKTVTVADLERTMIDFQKREFGVDGFVSGTDSGSIANHPRQYDVVFIFSLFTHLPKETWRNWLHSLAMLVCPGGHLIFSTHSYEFFASKQPAKYGDPNTWVDEFVFWETNETDGRLATSDYGCNIVKESFVQDAVDSLSTFKIVRHFKMGEFDRYHDIYVVRRMHNDELNS